MVQRKKHVTLLSKATNKLQITGMLILNIIKKWVVISVKSTTMWLKATER